MIRNVRTTMTSNFLYTFSKKRTGYETECVSLHRFVSHDKFNVIFHAKREEIKIEYQSDTAVSIVSKVLRDDSIVIVMAVFGANHTDDCENLWYFY